LDIAAGFRDEKSGPLKASFEADSIVVKLQSNSMEAFRIYRNLLRAVRTHIGNANKTHFQEYIMAEFRKNKDIQESSLVQQKLKLAHNYALLLNSVHHHKDLLFSYNIAIDREEEKKLTLKKSASSVGLQLPQPYED